MLFVAAAGTLQTDAGPAPATQPWVYPLQADWGSDQQVIPHGSGWNWVHWNCCGQSFMEIGGTLYFVLEAGVSWGTDQGTVWGAGSALSVFELEHANRAHLGIYTTTDLVTWTPYASNPVIEFDPAGTPNDIEEGTWHHAVAYDPVNNNYVMIYGGQRGAGTTSVDIAIYRSTSSNLLSWTPNQITDPATSRIISDDNDNNSGAFAGISSNPGEISPGGLRWDTTLGRWDLVYLGKNLANPRNWALFHCWGSSLTALTGANSEDLITTIENPMSRTRPEVTTDTGSYGQWQPGIIVDRGFGYIDVVAIAMDDAEGEFFTNCALVRFPVAEPGTSYSWANPGPTEVLYTARDTFMNIPAGMQMMATLGVYNTLNRIVLAYQQYRYGALTGQQQRQRMMHAPVVRTADGRPDYTPVATRFTAANSQFLSRASQMTGQRSTTDVCGFMAIKMMSLPAVVGGEMVLWRFEEGTSYRFVMVVNDAGVVRILARNDGGTGIIDVSATIPLVVGTWTTIAFSLTTATASGFANSWIRIGGADAKPASATPWTQDALIGFTDSASMRFGAENATTKFLDAEVADAGLCIGWHVPYASGAGLSRFLAASPATLQNPRTDGRGLFPSIPHVFFSGSGTAFQTNRGKGGAWVMNGGSLTAAASAPPGHSSGPVAPNAVDDTNPALTVDTGNQDIDVLFNDIYSGTPSISIQSQSGPGTATVTGSGAASRISVPTNGLSPGTKIVTYVLTATGNVGSDTATLTVPIQAASAAPTIVGTVTPSDHTGAASYTKSFTVTGNKLLVGFANDGTGTISNVRWGGSGGTALTLASKHAQSQTIAEIWELVNPTQTTANIYWEISSTTIAHFCVAIDVSGAEAALIGAGDKTSGGSASSALHSLSQAVVTNSLTISLFAGTTTSIDISVGPNSEGTELFTDVANASVRVAGQSYTSPSNQTIQMEFDPATAEQCAQVLVMLRPSGGGALLAYSGEQVAYSGEDVDYP